MIVSIPPRMAWKPRPHRLITDRRGLMESARSERCPSRQHGGPAAPEEDNFTSPDHMLWFTRQELQHPSDKNSYAPGRYRPLGVEILPTSADCRSTGSMGPVRGERSPSGQRRDPTPGDDKSPSLKHQPFHTSAALNTPGTKTVVPPVDTTSHVVETSPRSVDHRLAGIHRVSARQEFPL